MQGQAVSQFRADWPPGLQYIGGNPELIIVLGLIWW